jgi:hypothetical protein
MKCPLLMLAQRAHDGSHTIPIADCIEEECAWWRQPGSRCAVLGLLVALQNIEYRLSDLLPALQGKKDA